MSLGPSEPPAGPWRVEPIEWVTDTFAAAHMSAEGGGRDRPFVVAVDGRSAAGKSTLAAALSAHVPGSVVVHTDDVAWHHAFFDWSDLLRTRVLEPLRRRAAVSYRPPGWDERGRPGSIEIPASCPAVFIEGVGASRRELLPWIDAAVWVQSDRERAEEIGIARDGADEGTRQFSAEWMAAEDNFLAEDQPWRRADVIVAGNAEGPPHDPATEVVVAPPVKE